MTISCSYDPSSLFALRSQAISPLLHRYASAQQLNLWVPTAQKSERGHTQPFPFEHYIHGIGSIITSSNHINEIFADMSSDTPSDDPWATETQPEPISFEQDMAPPAVTDPVEAVAADERAGVSAEDSPANATPSAPSEVRKSSLADLGGHDSVKAHLAKGLGPHKLLSRFSSISQKSDTERSGAVLITNRIASNIEVSEPDGAASVVDDSTSVTSIDAVATRGESTQTAPDTDASKLFGTTPASSVTDGDKSVVHSPDISPRSVRKAPRRRLKALTLAQDIPLPQSPAPVAKSSTSDEGPETPVASTLDLEPVIIQDTPPAPSVTMDDGSESDTSRVIITEVPNSLPNKEKNLDPKAEAWVPDDSVGPLPPSRPDSPVNVTHHSEAASINECCPVPSEWSVPTKIGSFAEGNLFDDDLTVNGVHKTVLAYYSHYFATTFASKTSTQEEQLGHVVDSPSFATFRKWIFGRKLFIESSDGVTQKDQDIDLKVLVRLWRFAARIQAPLFANTVADVIVKKANTTDDIIDAADEINALLQMVNVNNTFRLLISHVVILRGIQPHDKWPQTLSSSILNCLKMGRKTYLDIQLSSQTPCAYHLHSLGHTCMS